MSALLSSRARVASPGFQSSDEGVGVGSRVETSKFWGRGTNGDETPT